MNKINDEFFEEIKNFLKAEKLKSFLTELESPIYPPYPFEVMKCGEEIKSGFIDPFFINSIKLEKLVAFSAENYDQKNAVLKINSQTFYPTESQIESILKENGGAIGLNLSRFVFLTKSEYKNNVDLENKIKASADFLKEYNRISECLKLKQTFLEVSKKLDDLGLENPFKKLKSITYKPVKPTELESHITMTSFVSRQYFAIIAKGVEVTKADINEKNLVRVHEHSFKLEDQQLKDLYKDNYGYIFDKNGFPHFSSKSQIEKKQEYQEQAKQYLMFEKLLNEAKDKIAKEEYAQNCRTQHEYFSNLPFDYYVAIKVNLRLLTGNNNGCGSNKRTVHHIVPKEGFDVGRSSGRRLQRKDNEYLCGGDSSYGTPNEKEDSLVIHSELGNVPYLVTCQQCLKFVNSILKYK